MNYIFGSGSVGLLAKKILGPSFTIVPFYKSRFFSYNPALDDNFIIRDDKLDHLIKDICGLSNTVLYKRAYSLAGELNKSHNKEYDLAWLSKVFGNAPSQSSVYMQDRLSFFVYDLRANNLYESLVNEYRTELHHENALGQVTEVGDHYFIRGGKRYDYDKLVSTIPLDILLKLMGRRHELKSKAVHYLHIASSELDFENCNQLLVLDNNIDFFKVTNVAPARYLFYFGNNIDQPGLYMMNFMRSFDILDGTVVDGALPLGERPKLDNLESQDIFCVGSYAQWDWCMDIGSCMLRLLKYSGRDNQAKPEVKTLKF